MTGGSTRVSAALLAGAALLLASCGGGGDESSGDEGDRAAAGKTIFTSNCGRCHTLSDAGTDGNVGPNLDQLKPDEDTVRQQVENGGGGMPAFEGTLSDDEIKSVAAYVSSAAG